MSETLETDRLILRRPAPQDWPPFRALFLSERSQFIRGDEATEGKAWRAFAAEFGHWDIRGYGMWTVTAKGDDTALGLIGPWHPIDWPDTEIGWMMFDGSEGKGYATEAAAAARLHAYDQLGWTRIVSYIADTNTRSKAVAERLGCVVDPDAVQPKPDTPCLVYVHPKREELS